MNYRSVFRTGETTKKEETRGPRGEKRRSGSRRSAVRSVVGTGRGEVTITNSQELIRVSSENKPFHTKSSSRSLKRL